MSLSALLQILGTHGGVLKRLDLRRLDRLGVKEVGCLLVSLERGSFLRGLTVDIYLASSTIRSLPKATRAQRSQKSPSPKGPNTSFLSDLVLKIYVYLQLRKRKATKKQKHLGFLLLSLSHWASRLLACVFVVFFFSFLSSSLLWCMHPSLLSRYHCRGG